MAMTPGDPLSSVPNSYKSPSTFMPFHGQGNRLNGKMKSKEQDQHQQQNNVQIQQARGVPNYDYEYGTLQFLRAPLRTINDDASGAAEKSSAISFQPFSGEGQMLKQARNQRPK
jgi:hypothetical protein